MYPKPDDKANVAAMAPAEAPVPDKKPHVRTRRPHVAPSRRSRARRPPGKKTLGCPRVGEVGQEGHRNPTSLFRCRGSRDRVTSSKPFGGTAATSLALGAAGLLIKLSINFVQSPDKAKRLRPTRFRKDFDNL